MRILGHYNIIQSRQKSKDVKTLNIQIDWSKFMKQAIKIRYYQWIQQERGTRGFVELGKFSLRIYIIYITILYIAILIVFFDGNLLEMERKALIMLSSCGIHSICASSID